MEDDVVTAARRRIMLLVLLVSLVGRSSSSTGVRFECFDDLCVSRLQYCSDNQQRCQYCRREHCLDPAFTPAQCRPLCPELLSTTPPDEATASSSGMSTSRVPDRQHGVDISAESLMTVTAALFILVIVLLIVILVLATCLCNYAIPVYRSVQRQLFMRANMLEENETLLKETRQNRKPGLPGETKGREV
ncbi:hypothetical protein C0Q70_00061 [Pomacea canaliculata]|uniref:TNFR-Cys domain-containing protein n=1 Tax=Pomacea canaliculata TaxID=400727 RepID=A0A2T7PVN0_POMCA|nr:hypothetical protein C0Q70_00061 [Pomacea canaliculata]